MTKSINPVATHWYTSKQGAPLEEGCRCPRCNYWVVLTRLPVSGFQASYRSHPLSFYQGQPGSAPHSFSNSQQTKMESFLEHSPGLSLGPALPGEPSRLWNASKAAKRFTKTQYVIEYYENRRCNHAFRK